MVALTREVWGGTTHTIHNLPNTLLPALVHLPDAHSRQLEDARGHNAYGNGISIPFVADVAKKNIEIIFDSPIYKRYDGTEQVDLPQHSYIGIINNEVTVVGDLQGSFNGSYVAEEVGITLSGVVLEGEKKDCYTLVLTGHYGRIHPSYVNDVSNSVSIEFGENVYVDVMATVNMKNIFETKKVNKLYINAYM